MVVLAGGSGSRPSRVVVVLVDSGEAIRVGIANYNCREGKRRGRGQRTMLGFVLHVNERIIK